MIHSGKLKRIIYEVTNTSRMNKHFKRSMSDRESMQENQMDQLKDWFIPPWTNLQDDKSPVRIAVRIDSNGRLYDIHNEQIPDLNDRDSGPTGKRRDLDSEKRINFWHPIDIHG